MRADEGGARGRYDQLRKIGEGVATGTSGGGGGGAGGSAADGIGSGGTGGGGGGGGANANIDGEPGGWFANLDDLWGYGGSGGSGAWGGGKGGTGDYGASNDGDDTEASRNYAKSGGSGGSSAQPSTVAFYAYKDSESADPKVTCTSGNGVTRQAAPLGNLKLLAESGAPAPVVSGGQFIFDGNVHRVTVYGPGGLSPQADDAAEAEESLDEGTFEVDGTTVSWSIAYYDASGTKLASAPVMPGSYAAVVANASAPAARRRVTECFMLFLLSACGPLRPNHTDQCGLRPTIR